MANKNYHLIANNKWMIESQNITKVITSSDRCLYIREIINETISNLHYLQHSKDYHSLCQMNSLNLSCFQDDIYLCVCENYHQRRHAQCMNYSENFTAKCADDSHCHSNGQC